MPYDRTEPPAWWHGAEAAPPMPEGPGLWTLVGTPYGWQWRRPEPDAPDEAAGVRDLMRELQRRVESALAPGVPVVTAADVRVSGTLTPRPDAGCQVRVGDALTNGTETLRVDDVHDTGVSASSRTGGLYSAGCHAVIPLSRIGPAGSGKPWTLLPPDPAPDAAATEARPATQLHAGGGGGIGPHAFPTGGSYVVGAGGAGAYVRHEPGPIAEPRAPWSRHLAASAAYEQALRAGLGGPRAMADALQAADAVAKSRRVVDAARAWARPDHMAAEMEAADALEAAVRALDALDGEAGE